MSSHSYIRARVWFWLNTGSACAFVCVSSEAFNWLEAPFLVERPAMAEAGLRLVRFMLNSVSISWLLPSLQRKSAERNTSPQKFSGFDRRSVQSFIPRPGATEPCQQTFHWNHIKPLLFPHFVLSLLCLSLFPSPSASLSLSFFTLCFLSRYAYTHLHSSSFLPPHPSPSGVSQPL